MKKGFINTTSIQGLLYQHSLSEKVSGQNSKNPGTKYITGSIDIVTDDKGVNIVPVHFSYVTETTSKGKTNANYAILKNIIDKVYKTVMEDGADKATSLVISSAIGLNEFYIENKESKELELISAKRNEGGFISVVSKITTPETDRNTFKADMLITGVRRIEPNEEKGLPEKLVVKGAIFDFRKALLPIEFSVTNPKGMDYFEGLEPSAKEPVFTQVWGRQVSEVIKRSIVTENAFGEDDVRIVENTRKDFVITGSLKDPYEWDDEQTLTGAELKEMMAERETYLATVKKNYLDYQEKKNQPVTATVTNEEFDF